MGYDEEPMVYKTTKKLTAEEGAYIAGLVDGEGTISLTRKHRGENRQLVLSISSTEKRILNAVLLMTGVGKLTRKRVYKDHHRIGLTYAVTNRQALDLLKQIQPYLHSYKADRVALVLQEYLRLTLRNGKYTPAIIQERENFIQRFFCIKPE